jgi:hypothetical protein
MRIDTFAAQRTGKCVNGARAGSGIAGGKVLKRLPSATLNHRLPKATKAAIGLKVVPQVNHVQRNRYVHRFDLAAARFRQIRP